jgi:hypothetical protein
MLTSKNTTSRNICKTASKHLKKTINPIIYKQYETYITPIINKFKKSQNVLLNNLFSIKKEIQFKITYIIKPLDKYNSVPPFIDIFRFLISKNEVISKFTLEEKTLLKSNLELHHSKEDCYKFLEKSNLGQKLLDLYYSISQSLKTELIAKFPSIEFHRLLINSFTSFKIIEDLELRIKKLVLYSIEWQGKKLDNLLYLFIYDNQTQNQNHSNRYGDIDYESIGNEIIRRIFFFNEFLKIDKLPSKFIIFLTNNKKEVDENVISHMHFKTINVNTAVTNGHDIIIYRQQELLKSIFHELIHFHNLDFRTIPPELIQYLIKTHNIKENNEYLLYECVTEALANILNNLFFSRNIKDFTNNLKLEIMFSTFQVAKILHICKYNKWDEFARVDKIDVNSNKINNTNPNKQFKQDSCVLSYYILKFYIMINLDSYFKKCLDTKIKFIQTTESFNNLIHIFDLARKNIFIKKIIDSYLNELQTKKLITQTGKKTSKINKTLRMTCLESNLFSKNSI